MMMTLLCCWLTASDIPTTHKVMAEHLSAEEAAGIKERFEMMDTGKQEKISKEELRSSLLKLGHQVLDSDLQIVMDAGLFEPVTVPLDTSFRGNAADLSDLDSKVKRTVTGWMPEQVMVLLSDEHSSVWILWITVFFRNL